MLSLTYSTSCCFALRACLLTTALVATACAPEGLDEDELGDSEALKTGTVQRAVSGGCSTGSVVGLSKQIAGELRAMLPDSLVPITKHANITYSGTQVLPYLTATANQALGDVAKRAPVRINSGFRTIAQQYLLYRWSQQRRCGIKKAARPGNSNHESGRALDIANYASIRTTLNNNDWRQTVKGDPIHFDDTSSPSIRGAGVQAFQRVWNRHNPSDKIAEDGAYGPQTEARLMRSPASGFGDAAALGELEDPTTFAEEASDDEGGDEGDGVETP